ncbi:MAG TPA: MgtC/SapB family protein [Desulfobacterales bacterium]
MVIEQILHIDWNLVLSHLIHLAVAYVLALPIGWDREQSKRRFGLRTFPIVAVVSCGFMLVGMAVIESTDGEARVLQGIITGIGFIGGGAILKNEDKVAGTASAASIWNTGAIGVSVAFSRFEIALVLALLNFLALRLFSPEVKEKVRDGFEGSSEND